MVATARAMASRSCGSDSRNGSTHRSPWQQKSWPARAIASATRGLRASATAAPNTVSGSLRSSNTLSTRQTPTRLPYSYIDS